MTSRRLLALLVASCALTGCMGGSDEPEGRRATPSASLRPTIAAPVPDGIVSATYDSSQDEPVDEIITRLNQIPGVLGAGYFAGEKRIVVRLKPDATRAQIEAAVAAVQRETALRDVVFEAPEPTASATPAPTPSAPSATSGAPSY